MTGKPIVLVVDDEERICDIVKSYLEKYGCRALSAGTGKEALEQFRQNDVSLVLLDLMLPDFPGEEFCRQLRTVSDVPVIMMTAKVDEESIINGLRIGADDYVTKPFSPRELMARVQAHLRRFAGQAGAARPGIRHSLSCGHLQADTENRRAFIDGKEIDLTSREFKILVLLMSRPQKIFTRDEIMDDLGDGGESFDRVIDAHIKNLRQKIGDDAKSPRYIHTVYGMGYRFAGEVRRG
jgi:DNA-binding response OmpR family regulator